MAGLTDLKKFKAIQIDKLVKADWNYKENDEELCSKLVENIKRNGQIENILVRLLDTGFYEIVNGNHRYDALKAVGAKVAIAYDLGSISTAEAMRIALETNETRFKTNDAKLASVIKEIASTVSLEELAATIAFSPSELDRLLSLADWDWDQYTDDGGAKPTPKEKPVYTDLEEAIAAEGVKALWAEWKEKVAKVRDTGNAFILAAALTLALRKAGSDDIITTLSMLEDENA